MRTILEARQTKLTKFNLTCQPIPVVIKEKEKKQTKYKCLVKYDNFEYVNLESPIKAVDVAFKSYPHSMLSTHQSQSNFGFSCSELCMDSTLNGTKSMILLIGWFVNTQSLTCKFVFIKFSCRV